MRKDSRYTVSKYSQSDKNFYEQALLSHVNLSDNNDEDL